MDQHPDGTPDNENDEILRFQKMAISVGGHQIRTVGSESQSLCSANVDDELSQDSSWESSRIYGAV